MNPHEGESKMNGDLFIREMPVWYLADGTYGGVRGRQRKIVTNFPLPPTLIYQNSFSFKIKRTIFTQF